jgi:hypothetical protein
MAIYYENSRCVKKNPEGMDETNRNRLLDYIDA